MADALVERRPATRFFCHRCNIEFEHILQDYTCPYCASGFIEQLEGDADGSHLTAEYFNDADMTSIDDLSNIDDMASLDDSDELQNAPPVLNDLAFLMSGGRLRGGAGRRETLMEQLILILGGARPGTGTVNAAAPPFVLVGAPGDYVFGGDGLDAVVTQLLGQLENAGPPPLPRDLIANIPSELISAEHPAANTSCSVCWENFQLGETISRLECDHIFHASCIAPWLQLHATCPICRRSLLPEEQRTATDLPPATGDPSPVATEGASEAASESSTTSLPRVLLRRILPEVRRLIPDRLQPSEDTSSSSGMSTISSVTAGWLPQTRSTTNSTTTTSSTSLNSNERDRQYNMDIDYD